MQRNRTDRELYQSHATVLVSLGYQSLVDIAQHSFATFRQASRSVLSWGESRSIYFQAQQHVAGLAAQRRKILKHANPQLKNALHLAINPIQQQTRDYETLFGQCADAYVPTSSVASMFSPAGYLTELYREGKQLHSDKPQHLDKRRPDLQSLLLSQSNQDAELTTLALSNDILLSTIQAHTQETDTQVRENLNNTAYPFDLPYHIPFDSIETALAVQNTRFEALAHALAPSQTVDSFSVTTRAAYANRLPPGLCDLLLKPIPSDEAQLNNMLMYHFGTADIEQLSDIEYFCQRVGITQAELDAYLALPGFVQSLNTRSDAGYTTEPIPVNPEAYGASYVNDKSAEGNFIAVIDGSLRWDTSTLKRTGGAQSNCNLLPNGDGDTIRFIYKFTKYISSPSTGLDSLTVKVNDKVVETRSVYDSYYNWLEFFVPLSGKMSGEIKIEHHPEWSTLTYTKSHQDLSAASLVRLSQIIRYAQKTGLSPASLDSLIALSQGSTPPAITNNTLLMTARALEYQQRYALGEDDALVLAGADINAYAPAGELSQFDRLFNNPPLNDVAFTTNDANDTISFAPTDTTYTHERAVLKRTLGVDDAGLATLAAIVNYEDETWARSLTHLSALYRVGLWARVHGLAPQELQRLLQLNGKTADLLDTTYVIYGDYLDAIYNTNEWLVAQQLSVAELNVMTSQAYPDTMTPEIDSFVRTLYQAVKGETFEVASVSSPTAVAGEDMVAEMLLTRAASPRAAALTPDPLHQVLAPYLSGTFGLGNVESAIAQQVWIEQVAAKQGLSLTSMAAFCDAIIGYCKGDAPTAEETAQLVTFSQALGQLAFIIKHESMSAAELNVVVYQPSVLGGALVDKLSLSLETMQSLSGLKRLLLRVGEGASECLTLLERNQLNATALARWLNMPESEVILAASCVGASENMMNAKQAAYALDWLEQAVTLGVSVQMVKDLLTRPLGQSYSDWQTVARAVQAGVVDPMRGQMKTALDEALSTALCAYFMSKVAPTLPSSIPMQNRDDLFNYLLIDNQVDGQVTTTQIAEAISSVQLYINRCLQGLEDDIDSNQLTEAFFVQWEQYNKRYSTWAGVSQLAYYPENYIDPTLRYNQSSLQRQLLNELHQSELNKDSVEAAYLNYLDGFEGIANLEVLCGYHHGTALDKGMSYFVGRSTGTPALYYWRSLNHEASDGLGGYTASAWTDWEEISGQLNAVNDEVRPVLFNNRLYIASVIEETTYEEVTQGDKPIQKLQYSLQLTYRQINGNWAPAMKFALAAIPDALFDNNKKPKFNVYLSYHPLQDAILFMLYDPSSDYDSTGSECPAYGGFIYHNMQLVMMEDSADDDDEAIEWGAIYSLFSNNLNSSSAPNKVIRYIAAQEYGVNVTPSSASNTADSDLLVVSDVDVVAEVDNLSVPPELLYTAQGTIQTKNIVTSPTAVIIAGDVSDNSGTGFDVENPLVTSKHTGNGFEFAANLSIKTTNEKVPGPVGASVSDLKPESELFPPVISELTAHINENYGLYVRFRYGDWGGTPFVKVVRLGNNETIYDAAVPGDPDDDIPNSYIMKFTDDSPVVNSEGLALYDISTRWYNDYEGEHTELLGATISVEYNDVALVEEVTVSFAGAKYTLPANPEGTYTIPTLTYTIPQSKDGSVINQPQGLIVTQGTAVWTQDFTLGHSAYTLGRKLTYNWGEEEITLPQEGTTYIDETYHYPIPANSLHQTRTLTVKQDGQTVFKQNFEIDVTGNTSAVTNPSDNIQMIKGDNEAAYLEKSYAPKRTRLNTLFARDLVNRAQAGLDNILSWEAQQLPEPKLGEGTYVKLVLSKYDPDIHGSSKEFTLYHADVFHPGDAFPVVSGILSSEQETEVQFFLPRHSEAYGDKDHLYVQAEYQTRRTAEILFERTDDSDPEGWFLSDKYPLFAGLESAQALKDKTEPMDFSGANGLYFWELFYYTPMMAAEKLLQSQDFEEAERWLNYVFNPAGYLEGEYPSRKHVDRQWNTRPLQEDTAWDDTPTDTTDPDVVAQADPMHYKVATFMKLLDILIARGDMAYRLLERDSLAEAKMWYVTAQQLLGPQPDLPEMGDWSNPSLSMAASDTTVQQSLMLMEHLMLRDVHSLDVPAEQPQVEARAEMRGENRPEMLSANALTTMFLPSENDKLNGYWQTLSQRLFNLRHNLSIDGQPLTLPLYATPADPKALQNAKASASAGSTSSLPNASLSIQRFPQVLESARELVGQLIQYGGTLTSVFESKDAEALDVMLQTQAKNLYDFSLQLIEQNLRALDEEQSIIEVELEQQNATMNRMGELYDQNISPAESTAITLKTLSSTLQYAKAGFELASAGLKSIPNIFGLAMGGSDYSAFTDLGWKSLDLQCKAGLIAADVITTTEEWRRRRGEWQEERDAAERQIRICQAKLRNIDIQKQAQQLQKGELEQQQANTQASYDFLTNKFSNEALYSWMQGRLAALYYQFYDLSIARCLKAQLGYQWETCSSATFIQPGAWDSNHAGLLCGESLMLSLAQMESAYLEWDARALEVSRTVSLAQEMEVDSAAFNDLVNSVLDSETPEVSETSHSLTLDGEVFRASIDLKSLNIANDYPDSVVTRSRYRLIKQVSVTLPALLGPYQDIQAVLGYSVGGGSIHPSCLQTAISHGINDSGQFLLDFNDSKYLPFEGLPVDGSDNASLTLSFPNAGDNGKQRAILQSLNDIVLHISYTIRD